MLSKEKRMLISSKPEGKFRKTETAKKIIERVSKENGGLIDELTLNEGRAWSELSGKMVGAEGPLSPR